MGLCKIEPSVKDYKRHETCRKRTVISGDKDYPRRGEERGEHDLSFGDRYRGTYTDAVILREESEVIASAKSLTTREDLALGIGSAVQSVLNASALSPAQISMASLPTTLASNEVSSNKIIIIFSALSIT